MGAVPVRAGLEHSGEPLQADRAASFGHHFEDAGSGKVSASMLKNVAQAYERGSIEVSVQPAEYKVTIHFRDTLGIPPNLSDLKSAIEEIKPAHIAVDYALRYLTIAEVEGMTFEEISATTQDRLLGGGA